MLALHTHTNTLPIHISTRLSSSKEQFILRIVNVCKTYHLRPDLIQNPLSLHTSRLKVSAVCTVVQSKFRIGSAALIIKSHLLQDNCTWGGHSRITKSLEIKISFHQTSNTFFFYLKNISHNLIKSGNLILS